jgi:hypothetical protein
MLTRKWVEYLGTENVQNEIINGLFCMMKDNEALITIYRACTPVIFVYYFALFQVCQIMVAPCIHLEVHFLPH